MSLTEATAAPSIARVLKKQMETLLDMMNKKFHGRNAGRGGLLGAAEKRECRAWSGSWSLGVTGGTLGIGPVVSLPLRATWRPSRQRDLLRPRPALEEEIDATSTTKAQPQAAILCA